ncbi:hypothetical protein EGI22_11045 [Lacihabitans sp. LS3-19]|uniref:hypothetical protein n=1 Tax=Lacihabitans sp. LS3-19 TaxID=2487335 RepID=UPI0020CE05D5|nr:hypothetical protein [Lacihabitans sp. LS3-19]MCP9768451.1 hypothetical protein [Lacihabitans sp. LS3-19]
MQNPEKSPFLIFFILLLCFSNIRAQKKLSDFTYQIQTSKSLEIDIYQGEDGVFWIKTKNNPSNEDELSVFDTQKGEIIVIKDDKLPKKIFVRQFYQSKNLGFFIMQNQENFLPFFVVINHQGKIIEKKELLPNIDLNPKLVGIKNEVYFTILNDFYSYDFKNLQLVEIPKQNNISIQLSQNHSLYKTQNDWLISDNDLLITSKKVIKASLFFNDSQYRLQQIEDQLLAITKYGLFEIQVIDGQPVLENVSSTAGLFY